MRDLHGSVTAVAGNVYFCNFPRQQLELEPQPEPVRVESSSTASDIRMVAEALALLCREIGSANRYVQQQAERYATELADVLAVVDETAFQAHIVAVESERSGADCPAAADILAQLRSGMRIATEVRTWLDQTAMGGEHALRRLRGDAEQVRTILAAIAERIDAALERARPRPGAN